ncbi:hypothetical protein [Gallaecimonas sp. GXIMD1310]|uniref:hypothetical protein n=1 Tax=Gallaecimonas sp. GXIMD1310 TaxID=3131926 RepID=UPI003247F5C5
MKKYIFLLLLGVFSTVHADTSKRFVICDDCMSDASMKSKAESYEYQVTSSTNYIYILNHKTGSFKEYRILHITGIDGQPDAINFSEVTPSTDEITEKDNIQVTADSIFNTSNFHVPDTIATSAYQLSNNTSMQNAVNNYYNNTMGLMDNLVNLSSQVIDVWDSFDVEVEVTAYFTDGSYAVYKVTAVNIDASNLEDLLKYRLQLVKLVDANGNDIPVTGTYTDNTVTSFLVPSSNWTSFQNAMELMGIPVIDTDIVPSGSDTIQVNCNFYNNTDHCSGIVQTSTK